MVNLLRILINTSQSNFGDLNLDDGCIRDIADVITADMPGDPGDDGGMSAQQEEEIGNFSAMKPEFEEESKSPVRSDGKRLAYV